MKKQQFHKRRGFHSLGDSLDWNSTLVDIQICTELPFWLFTPDTILEIDTDYYKGHVYLISDSIEIQRGNAFMNSRDNLEYIGNMEYLKIFNSNLSKLLNGTTIRKPRTLIALTAKCLKDAQEAIGKNDYRRYADAHNYFASLSNGHIPVLNYIINMYRAAAIDPYAHEVSAFDVPTWYVSGTRGFERVHLDALRTADNLPINKANDKITPISIVDTNDLTQRLKNDLLPGEIEMLDGWSLFHAERYIDSIRSFVTAIEVFVEHETRSMLKSNNLSNYEINARLDSTRMNFEKRLDQFCVLANRSIPGPILRDIPYINGIRLKDELFRTRDLRNMIVHHGLRLNQTFKGPALKSAETTSWLYDWLTNGDFEKRRSSHLAFFAASRTCHTFFSCSYVDGNISVNSLSSKENRRNMITFIPGDVYISDKYYIGKLGTERDEHSDLEHFCKISFYELGMGELIDSPPSLHEFKYSERFYGTFQNQKIVFYLISLNGVIDEDDISEVSRAVTAGRTSANFHRHTLIIVNNQNRLPWHRRADIPESIRQRCGQLGLSVISATKLAKYIKEIHKYEVDTSFIMNTIIDNQISIPEAIGKMTLYNVWDKPHIAGFAPVSGVCLQSGARYYLELKDKLKIYKAGSVRCDPMGRITTRVPFKKKDTALPSEVIILEDGYVLRKRKLNYREKIDEMLKDSPGAAFSVVMPQR